MAKKDLTMTDEKIIQLIRPLQEKADQWYDDLREEREKCRKLYDREKYGNEREGFSGYVAALVWNTVEWLKPGITSIFASEDFFDVKHKDDGLARRIKKCIRYQMFRKQDGEKETRAFIHDVLLYHFGLHKVCYREISDQAIEKFDALSEEAFNALSADPNVTLSKYDEVQDIVEQVVPDQMTGLPVQISIPSMSYENVKAVRKVVKYAGPVFECIPGHEFRMVQAKSVEESPLVAHVKRKTLDEIKRGEMTGQYIKGSYEKLKDRIGEVLTTGYRDDEAKLSLYGADGLTLLDDDHGSLNEQDKELIPSYKVEVWENYVNLDIDGDGLLEPCIISTCGDIVLQKQENDYGSSTIVMGKLFEIPHRAEGRPMPKILEDDQKEMTNLRRIFVDSSAESAYSTMVTSDMTLAKNWSKRKVGSVILAQNSDKMTEVRPRPPGRTALDAMESMRIDAERSVGVNSLNQGIDDNSYGKTATGTMALQNAGQQKQRFYASVMAGSMKEVIRRFIDINKKWPPSMLFDTSDPDAIQPGDFENLDDFDIETSVGIGPQDKAAQVQALELHQQKLIKVLVPQGLAAPEHILATEEKIGRLQEVPFSNLQYSPEQFNTMQRMMQQLQQMQAQLQQTQGALQNERNQRLMQQRSAFGLGPGGPAPGQAGQGPMGQPLLPRPPVPSGPGIPGGNPMPVPGPGAGVPGPQAGPGFPG